MLIFYSYKVDDKVRKSHAYQYKIFFSSLILFSSPILASSNPIPFYLQKGPVPPPADAPVPSFKISNPIPIITTGRPGDWDSSDVLNPSVLFFKGKYFNYYSGFDGHKWSTGIATSDNGTEWNKFIGNPVLFPETKSWDTNYISANGGATIFRGKVYYAYQGKDKNGVTRIGMAVSNDGYHFLKKKNPILPLGPNGSWDSKAVADPYLYNYKGVLYMYYLGQNEADIQRLGVAMSVDGVNWVKSNSNPILDVGAKGSFDENGLGEPAVEFIPPYFYMLYTGRRSDEQRNLGFATSLDGVNWKKVSSTGEVPNKLIGPWASKVICDPSIIKDNNKILLFFGAGNLATPDERLNGQIGYLELESDLSEITSFNPNSWKREMSSIDFFQGSYHIEGSDGSKYVWIKEKSEITLTREKKNLTIKMWVPAKKILSSSHELRKVKIIISVNGVKSYENTITDDSALNISIPPISNKILDSKLEEINIEVHGHLAPSSNQDGDKRELAAIVNYIGYKQ